MIVRQLDSDLDRVTRQDELGWQAVEASPSIARVGDAPFLDVRQDFLGLLASR